MIELDVNFEELEHMDLKEAKKIVSHFDITKIGMKNLER